MDKLDFNKIFEKQLKESTPLDENCPQIVAGRKDFFGREFEVGEIQLYAALEHVGATFDPPRDISNDPHTIEITSISVQSFDELEKLFDFKEEASQNLPRFRQKGL